MAAAHTSSLSSRNSGTKMKAGIYHIRFSSAQGDHGEGLAVFKDGTVNGGDQGYLYLGTFRQDGSQVTAWLRVKRWNKSAVSVFGPLAEFGLQVGGTVAADDSSFKVAGPVSENQLFRIEIVGRRIADAV